MTMTNHFKAVGFDLGGVVIGNAVPKVYDYIQTGLHVSYTELKNALNDLEPLLQKNEISEEEFWAKLNHKLGVSADVKVEPSYWTEHYIKDSPIRSKVLELVDVLKAKGYKTGLLSNIDERHLKLNEQRHIFNHFDVALFSSKINAIKPEPRAYTTLLDALSVKASELIFIDDLIANVIGAQQIGIYGIKFVGYSVLIKELKSVGIEL